MDPVAGTLHRAARAAWDRLDAQVLRYTALVRQRFAVALRTPLKDRTLYRAESARRVFWDRDRDPLVQVLAHREQTPAGVEEEVDVSGMFDDAFDPAGDRLLFGATDREEEGWGEPEDDDFYVRHPLAPGSAAAYRFRSGDTLTLSLPDGRRVQAVELQVIPRVDEVHRIRGSLWIEPESGALVRAVYRLADTFDAFRDIPDLREEEDDDLRFVPGLFKPFTFELRMVAVDYALWDFGVWLPRSMRMEGVAGAGILKAPATMEIAYRMESVLTEADRDREATGEAPAGVVEEVHFETRAEAMAFLAELASREGVPFRVARDDGGGADPHARYLVPRDPEQLRESPALPPPIWEDAPGFLAEREVDELMDLLGDVPTPERTQSRWMAHWGLQRPGLVRYNRVEALAVGARLQGRVGSPVGPLDVVAEPFVAVGGPAVRGRVAVERSSVKRTVALGVYHELRSLWPRERNLGPGNSLNALLWGRDDGEYFDASGVEVVWTPPPEVRESRRVRLYVERHHDVDRTTDFTLAHAFDDGWAFRPTVEAEVDDEVGLEAVVRPWWGRDPLAAQGGVTLYAQAAARDEGDGYGRARILGMGSVPLPVGDRSVRLGAEVEVGQGWGDVPVQRQWVLGGPRTLRGYPASVAGGEAFARARVGLSRQVGPTSLSLFGDGGWAGDDLGDARSHEARYSVGVGVGLLDGLIRLDLARGLDAPVGTRLDLYLDAAF
jgi:hypothetical protein